MTGIIIYKGKYGATRQYANWLSNELKLPVVKSESCGNKVLKECDYIILGSSVYIGRLQLKKWLKRKLPLLVNKKVFLFIVCGTPSNETEKLAEYTRLSVPAPLLKNCSLFYLPGKLVYNRLSIVDKFLLKMGARLTKDAKTKKSMLTDYNAVKKENLVRIIEEVRKFTNPVTADPVIPGASYCIR